MHREHHLILFGKWNKDLTGIWVAKYEASRSDATFLNEGTSNKIKIVPDVKAITDVSINDAFKYSMNYKQDMESHLIKNSEWGAVAYLAYSAYGRNTDSVKPNLSSNMITGAGTSTNGATYATTSEAIFNNQYSYHTKLGVLASTTKNIFGVYDMVGGASEYVSAYVNNGELVISTYGDLLQGTSTMHFSQEYAAGITDNSANNYDANSGIYGDAIFEISTNERRTWNDNKIYYPNKREPFFTRGGSFETDYETAGIFEVGSEVGDKNATISFRPVLVP